MNILPKSEVILIFFISKILIAMKNRIYDSLSNDIFFLKLKSKMYSRFSAKKALVVLIGLFDSLDNFLYYVFSDDDKSISKNQIEDVESYEVRSIYMTFLNEWHSLTFSFS